MTDAEVQEESILRKAELRFERLFFAFRGALLLFFAGILLSIFLLLVKFIEEFWKIFLELGTSTDSEVIVSVLALVDTALVANLLLIVAFVGYHHFVSRLTKSDQKDYPSWLNKIDFNGLKLKVIGSVIAIAAIHFLGVFVELAESGDSCAKHWEGVCDSEARLFWMATIFSLFIAGGVLVALMDYFSKKSDCLESGAGQ